MPGKQLLWQRSLPSPDSALIATVQPSSLVIRCARTNQILQTTAIPHDFSIQYRFLAWSSPKSAIYTNDSTFPESESVPASLRLLVANDEDVRIYDPADLSWKAVVTNVGGGLGRISDVVFGYTSDEIVVFLDFGVKMIIWSLLTSQSFEIRDPKFTTKQSYSYRPGSGHLAILTRSSVQDIMLILEPRSHKVSKSVELRTVDAQEISWSQDGHWVAVRDTPSSGYRVLLYTADGNHYKTWSGRQESDIDQGVKSLQWNKVNTLLAIGDYGDRVTFLGKQALTWIGDIQHTVPIGSTKGCIWEEQLDGRGQRSYTRTTRLANPPTSDVISKTAPPKTGISLMTFDCSGTMLATRSDSTPTTAWIWCLKSGRLLAALIHHSPIKRLEWHWQEQLLMIQCSVPDPILHLWKSTWVSPTTLTIPLQSERNKNLKFEATWLHPRTSFSNPSTANVFLSSPTSYATTSFNVEDGTSIPNSSNMGSLGLSAAGGEKSIFNEPEEVVLSIGSGPEDMFDEGNSLDLSPIKLSQAALDYRDKTSENGNDRGMSNEHEGFATTGASDEGLDDTFLFHRKLP